MKRKLIYLLVVGFVAIQFIRPERPNPPVDASHIIQAHLQVPADVDAILQRACYACHSNETRWPWYSNIAPISWLIADDVEHARRHVNFSEWPAQDLKKVDHALEEICEVVEQDEMPLKSYVWLHPEARLSGQDKERICEWTRQARQQLVKPAESAEPSGSQ